MSDEVARLKIDVRLAREFADVKDREAAWSALELTEFAAKLDGVRLTIDRELIELDADLRRRANACDNAADTYDGEASGDAIGRARCLGKATAYQHAAEMVMGMLERLRAMETTR